MSGTKIINKRGHFLVETADGYVKMANRSNGLFPKRAILRVGMLLRDSEVAKEVRTQLLNIEEKAPEVIKKAEVDTELSLIKESMADAIISGDMTKYIEATVKLNAYKDRYTKQVEAKLKEVTIVHNATLDSFVVSKAIGERFIFKGKKVSAKKINEILLHANYIERGEYGLVATELGLQLGAKEKKGKNGIYEYTYVMWPNRVVEDIFYPIFKSYGLSYKTADEMV